MKKNTLNDHPVSELIKTRWSTRAFASDMIEDDKLRSLLEAARWAPSAFNEQPWRYIVGKKGEKNYNNILETLVEWNQKWAITAPVLILNIAKKTFSHNGKPNVTFKYDLGQSVAFMVLEGINQGLVSHQMSGFNVDKAIELFNISDDYQPVSVTAFGYQGDKQVLEKEFQRLELKPRERRQIDQIIFI